VQCTLREPIPLNLGGEHGVCYIEDDPPHGPDGKGCPEPTRRLRKRTPTPLAARRAPPTLAACCKAHPCPHSQLTCHPCPRSPPAARGQSERAGARARARGAASRKTAAIGAHHSVERGERMGTGRHREAWAPARHTLRGYATIISSYAVPPCATVQEFERMSAGEVGIQMHSPDRRRGGGPQVGVRRSIRATTAAHSPRPTPPPHAVAQYKLQDIV
jgi:hypothetical protein